MNVRNDLRKDDEMRELLCELGLVSEAVGSCRLQQGNTSVIVSVYGPIYGQNRNNHTNYDDDNKTSLDISISLPEEVSGVDNSKLAKKYESYLCKRFIFSSSYMYCHLIIIISLSSCISMESNGVIIIRVKVIRDDGSLLSVGNNII